MARPSLIITGGAGFVGQWLAAEVDSAYDVTVWDRPQVDITDPSTYEDSLTKIQPQWLVHLAAISSARAAQEDPDTALKINTIAVEMLLKKIAEVSADTKVLAVSSADIYGHGSPLPLSELPLPEAHPINPYAQTKWDMEALIEKSFNGRVIRVRPFPHIGPGQRQGFVSADFASQIAAIEKGNQPPVLKVGNLDAVRDFTDVRDVVRAYRLLLEKGTVGEVYHVASGQGVSIKSLLDQLLVLSTVKITVQEDPSKLRPSDTPILIGDAAKLRNLTGWQPEIPLNKSLEDILNYWREQ